MCGFAGEVCFGGGVARETLLGRASAMGRAQQDRGPDEVINHVEDGFAVTFQRLGIVAPDGPSQPLTNENDDILLVANAEIYNHISLRSELERAGHHFATQCDVEVILHAYEDDPAGFAGRLRGMYAFALFDRRRCRLVLGRDPFGIKPLFWTAPEGSFLFASELKGLLAHPECPRRIDWAGALSDPYLRAETSLRVAAPITFFEDISHVPPGGIVQLDVNRRRIMQLTPRDTLPYDSEAGENATALVARYGDALEAAVSDHLMGDRGIGVMLSGGIDSAVIASLAARDRSISTYGILTPATWASGDARGAAEHAEQLGLPHAQVVIDSSAAVLKPSAWLELLWACETPFCGPEQLLKAGLYGAVRRSDENLRIMLTGQGSDEFNGGYSTLYVPDESFGWQGFELSLELLADNAARMTRDAGSVWAGFLHADLVTTPADGRGIDVLRCYERCKHHDLVMYNNWHEDRLAARVGAENRVPFLDPRVVGVARAVPPALRQELLWDKTILRRAAQRWLPDAMRMRPKVPFFYGAGSNFAADTMVATLSADDAGLLELAFGTGEAADIVSLDSARSALARIQANPRHDGWEALLRLTNLGLLEHLLEGRPGDPPPKPLEIGPLHAVNTVADLERVAERYLTEFDHSESHKRSFCAS